MQPAPLSPCTTQEEVQRLWEWAVATGQKGCPFCGRLSDFDGVPLDDHWIGPGGVLLTIPNADSADLVICRACLKSHYWFLCSVCGLLVHYTAAHELRDAPGDPRGTKLLVSLSPISSRYTHYLPGQRWMDVSVLCSKCLSRLKALLRGTKERTPADGEMLLDMSDPRVRWVLSPWAHM